MHDPLHCPRCARTFNTDRSRAFVDLTLTSGVTSRVYKEFLWGGVEIFRWFSRCRMLIEVQQNQPSRQRNISHRAFCMT